ncbi:hypothetical protein AeRB84_004790 [Aphanomyces euteiches]|nr:hypothetical protein AeRB84_004790 [Aphanomyces euteiches]
MMAGAARHVVVFGELSPEQRQKYTKFIIDNKVKFGRNQDGLYVATVALHSAKHANPNSSQEPIKPRTDDEQRQLEQDMPLSLKRYTKLYGLLESPIPMPSKNVQSEVHVARTIHDIYDARWDDFQRDASSPGSHKLFYPSFAHFVYHHFHTKFGLGKLVAQNAVDLLQSLHANKARLDHEIFSSFLDETYDDTVLEFYLFARFHVIALLTRDTLGGKINLFKESIWISKAQCLAIATTIFGSRVDPRYLIFLRKLKHHLTRQPASRRQTHIIEMNELLLVAIDTFIASRPLSAVRFRAPERLIFHCFHVAESVQERTRA